MSDCTRLHTPITGEVFARLWAQDRLVKDRIYFVTEDDKVNLYYALSTNTYAIVNNP